MWNGLEKFGVNKGKVEWFRRIPSESKKMTIPGLISQSWDPEMRNPFIPFSGLGI